MVFKLLPIVAVSYFLGSIYTETWTTNIWDIQIIGLSTLWLIIWNGVCNI